MANGFGTAKMNSSNRIQVWRLADGHNIYRLVPPIKSLAASGGVSRYYVQHFGYKRTDHRDDSKSFPAPFLCIEVKNKKTEMIETMCPECEMIKENLEKLGEMTEGTAEYVEMAKWIKDHNYDKKHFFNAMNSEGEFGVLALPHKARQALAATAKELKEEGVDAFHEDSGVWFDFHRSGSGNDTLHRALVVKERAVIDGRTFQTPKPAALSEEQKSQAIECCPDLAKLDECGVLTRLTPAQVAKLVASGGDPDLAKEIFEQAYEARKSEKAKEAEPEKAATPEKIVVPEKVRALVTAAQKVAPQKQVIAEPKKAAPPPEPEPEPEPEAANVDAEVQELERQMAEIMARKKGEIAAKKVAAKAVETAKAAAPVTKKTPASNPLTMTDEEFDRQIGELPEN